MHGVHVEQAVPYGKVDVARDRAGLAVQREGRRECSSHRRIQESVSSFGRNLVDVGVKRLTRPREAGASDTKPGRGEERGSGGQTGRRSCDMSEEGRCLANPATLC